MALFILAEVITLTLPLSRKAKVEVVSECGLLKSTNQLNDDEVLLRSGEVKQVLLNLVRNAIQASPPGQKVTVSASTDSENVTITVSNNGHGIPSTVIAKVFDPFFSTKTEAIGQGMGLGLSVSHGIIEAMKGTIEVSSEPDSGTKFLVRLPRQLD